MNELLAFFIFLACMGSIFFAVWTAIRYYKYKDLKDEIISKQDMIRAAVNEFWGHLDDSDTYFNRRKYEKWLSCNEEMRGILYYPLDKLKLPKSLVRDCRTLQKYFADGERLVEKHNSNYVKRELDVHKRFFDEIETYPLNQSQSEAIVHDEDHNLVIAGAGTGKTTSIVGKVGYLVKCRGIAPENILVLAFARNPMEEMRERIAACLGNESENACVHTFHSFGLNIIGNAEGEVPDLAFEDELESLQYLEGVFREKMENDSRYKGKIAKFLAYYLVPYKPPTEFANYEEKRKHWQDLHTFQGERVKSHEEWTIANFLFLHGINYEYEREYIVNVADERHRQYKPDFYLVNYNIYIEHFGIDREGRVAKWFSGRDGRSASEVYRKSMEWKRNLHREHETVLVETFSYERQESVLLDNLRDKLENHGVELHDRPSEESMRAAVENKQENISRLSNLLSSVLSLHRSNNFDEGELKTRGRRSEDPKRAEAFIEVFLPVLEKYEGGLAETGKIDFSEMLCRATKLTQEGHYQPPFKYILIDEFQDMSIGRYKLTKALLDQNPEQKLYCVGDDWQSIYRFTGSDISIIVDFEKYFGYTRRTILDETYRFNNQIAEVSGSFIQRNPRQLQKELTTQDNTEIPGHEIVDMTEEEESLDCILERLNLLAEQRNRTFSVFLIGRYNFNRPNNFNELRINYGNLDVSFHTAHRSKGLEADIVIIEKVVAGRYGFPCQVMDDPLLQLVLAEPEPFEHAEERRLFYVAMTRARKKFYIRTVGYRKSAFVQELQENETLQIKCPACENGYLFFKTYQNREFWGCNNYDFCQYNISSKYVNDTRNFEWVDNQGKGRICPRCESAYLVVRVRHRDNRPFRGCSNWRRNGTDCHYTEPLHRNR